MKKNGEFWHMVLAFANGEFFFFFFLLTELLDSFLLFISRFGDLIVLVRLWSGRLGMRGHLHIIIG